MAKNKATKRKIAKTSQQAMPFEKLLKNGVLQISENRFSKMYEFKDINFETLEEEGQEKVVEAWAKLLKAYPDNVSFAYVIRNRVLSDDELIDAIHLKDMDDNLNNLRHAYNEILDSKIAEGHSDIAKTRYFIAIAETKDEKSAQETFATLTENLNEAFSSLQKNAKGVREIFGYERVCLMREICRGREAKEFLLPYKKEIIDGVYDFDIRLAQKHGYSVKDLIAPYTIAKKGKARPTLQLDEERFCRSYLFTEYPISLDTKTLSRLTAVPCESVTTVILNTIPKNKAVQMVKVMNNAVKNDVAEAQKNLGEAGLTPDLMSDDLVNARDEAKELRDGVMIYGDKLFYATVSTTIFDKNEEELDKSTVLLKTKAGDCGLTCDFLNGQQMAGFEQSLLTGAQRLIVDRMLTNESACGFLPFKVQDIYDASGLFYGINAVSKNLIMYDRRTSSLPNGFTFGRAGSGKSFINKGESIPSFLKSNNDMFIFLDPDEEYVEIAKEVGGTTVYLSQTATEYINPCDLSMEWGVKNVDPVKEKCDYMVSLVESILGDNRECTPYQVTAIHRATLKMYEPYVKHMTQLHQSGSALEIDREACPTLVDFYETLLSSSDDGVSDGLAHIIEPYATGAYDIFAHKTNVNVDNNFTVYVTKYLPEKMKGMAMFVCLANIWNRLCENKEAKRATWVYLDEFYLLCRTKSAVATLQAYFKRCRKYFGIMTGITQDITDLMQTNEGIGMLENCGFLVFMRQSPTGRNTIQQRYGLSNTLIDYVNDRPSGIGLLYTDHAIVPFDYRLPKNNPLFKLMNTKPTE